MQIRPIYQAHPRTRHQHHHIPHLIHRRSPPLPSLKLIPRLLRQRRHRRSRQAREQEAGRDGVHADVVVSGLERGCLGDAQHGVLRCCVGQGAWERHDGVDGGAVDDRAALGDAAFFA